jgi:hypothetical protein
MSHTILPHLELQLQGRLSIYVKPQDSFSDSLGPSNLQNEGDDEDTFMTQGTEVGESEHGALDFDSDPELDIHGDVDNVFDLDVEEEEEERHQPLYGNRSSASLASASVRSTVVLGPPQDIDVKPKKKVPPQVHLLRFEDHLHKLTQSLSVDKAFSSTVACRPSSPSDEAARSVIEERAAAKGKKKGKKVPLDAFDKRLGYRVRHSNPVTQITSLFLGPLMRIFRILSCVTRVVFNVGVWSDPYLSFWVLCFLIVLMLVLLVFPWRLFFFVVGAAGFGPQVCVRKMNRSDV